MAACRNGKFIRRFCANKTPQTEADAFAKHLRACSKCQCRVAAERGRQTTTPSVAELPSKDIALHQWQALPPNFYGPRSPLPVLPGYTFVRLIGEGGMGVVYEAKNASGVTIAVKVLRQELLTQPRERQRFLDEAEIIRTADHPNIVKIIEIIDQIDKICFVMESCAGGSLADRLKRQEYSEREAAALVRDIGHGLAHLHERGVVHRDLKPGNVLLTPDGVPKVADLGLAKRLDAVDSAAPHTATGAILGTYAYLSPEQAAGLPADFRTDIFGLGAILYELLTGKPPWQGKTGIDLIVAALQCEILEPHCCDDGIDRKLESVCWRALQKYPAKRYPSVRAFSDDLDAWLKGRKTAGILIDNRVLLRRAFQLSLTGLVLVVLGLWCGFGLRYLLTEVAPIRDDFARTFAGIPGVDPPWQPLSIGWSVARTLLWTGGSIFAGWFLVKWCQYRYPTVSNQWFYFPCSLCMGVIAGLVLFLDGFGQTFIAKEVLLSGSNLIAGSIPEQKQIFNALPSGIFHGVETCILIAVIFCSLQAHAASFLLRQGGHISLRWLYYLEMTVPGFLMAVNLTRYFLFDLPTHISANHPHYWMWSDPFIPWLSLYFTTLAGTFGVKDRTGHPFPFLVRYGGLYNLWVTVFVTHDVMLTLILGISAWSAHTNIQARLRANPDKKRLPTLNK